MTTEEESHFMSTNALVRQTDYTITTTNPYNGHTRSASGTHELNTQ